MKKTIIILFVVNLLLLFSSCQKDDEVDIGVHAEIKNVTTFHGHDGEIDLTVTGGVKPINYFWSNNETTEDLRNLEAGIYSVIISDRLNTSVLDTFEIVEPEPEPMYISFETKYPTKTGGSDGAVKAIVTGGYPPYKYSWSNGLTTELIEGIPADIYIVTITDNKNFTATDTVSLIDYIVDSEGNRYGFINFGNQVWLKNNLRVTRTSEGLPITSFIYNNDTTNEDIYGRLYAWNDAMNGSRTEKSQGVCPAGWHIPSDEEFKELEKFLGMPENEVNKENEWRGDGIGTILKLEGSSGYNAQLSGRRFPDGSFSQINYVEYIWTSTEFNIDAAWRRTLDKDSDKVGRWNTSPKTHGYSIRCVKN